MSKKAQKVQADSGCKGIQGSTSKAELKRVCLNARSIINKKNELDIMVDEIKPHIIGVTESWANDDITDAELGLESYVMFRKDRMGKRGGGVLLYIKETIPAYEVQLQEEADCKEAIWCKLVTGHTTVTIGVVYRCPKITKQNNEKIHNAISEVSKGDCIIMEDFNHGNIKWDTLQGTGVEDQTFLCLIQDNWRLTDMDYADDIALFSPSSEYLSSVLRILSKEAAKVGMSISWTKTKAMMISPSSAITTPMNIDGELVEFVPSFTYLGSIISLPTAPLRQTSLPVLARQQVPLKYSLMPYGNAAASPDRQSYECTVLWSHLCCYMALRHGT